MVHVYKSLLVLETSLERAWDFFSDPRNLARITPPELDFTVLSELTDRVYPGMMIEYRVRPLFGIPMRWVTEITHVKPKEFFVDEQRVGPYRIWHHEHHFKEVAPRRTEMADRVTYALPFPPFGELAHGLLVRPQIENIFAFREKTVAGIFR